MTTPLIHSLLALALVVLIPLAASLEEVGAAQRRSIAGLGLLGSLAFLVPEGATAAVIAVPWVLTPVILFGVQVRRFSFNSIWIRGTIPIAYLFVGTGWLVISRAGARPLGFSTEVVELTAVHFHYAGFVAPLLMRQLLCWLERERDNASRAGRVAELTLLVATPVTAMGISFLPPLGTVGAALFASSLLVWAVLSVTKVVPRVSARSAFLLRVSAWSTLVTMSLAVAYSVGQWAGAPSPSLPAMVWTHGILNGIGFSLAGLVGWRLIDPR